MGSPSSIVNMNTSIKTLKKPKINVFRGIIFHRERAMEEDSYGEAQAYNKIMFYFRWNKKLKAVVKKWRRFSR